MMGRTATITRVHAEEAPPLFNLKFEKPLREFEKPDSRVFDMEDDHKATKVPSGIIRNLSNAGPYIKLNDKVSVDWSNVMLLSGQAGSGKSTSIEKLKVYILREYTKKRAEMGITVILLPVTLPTLRDPLSGIFDEGCRNAYGEALRESQIHELREHIQDANGNYEIVFLLDAYDELPIDARSRNLWRTNNLERLRPRDSTFMFYPKVLITSRSELFEGIDRSEYSNLFYPIESSNEWKDESAEAKNFFQEYRLIPFGPRRLQYTQQHVAVQWRDQFLVRFPDAKRNFQNVSCKYSEVYRQLVDVWVKKKKGWAKENAKIIKMYSEGSDKKYDIVYDDDDTVKERIEQRELEVLAGNSVKGPHVAALMGVFEVSTVRDADTGESSSTEKLIVNAWNWYEKISIRTNDGKDITAGIIAILAALANFPINDKYTKSLKVFRDVMEEDAWTFKEFKSAYENIPELIELTTTPFMTNIGRSNFVRGFSNGSLLTHEPSLFACSVTCCSNTHITTAQK